MNTPANLTQWRFIYEHQFRFHPSPAIPRRTLGNPPYPGLTSSNGPNWMGYLTTKYNKSAILTYNFAVDGTNLTNHITAQIYQPFMYRYADGYEVNWQRDDTLFVLWIGINDINTMNNMPGHNMTEMDKVETKLSFRLLSSLYGIGARNFLPLNVPPIDRCFFFPPVSQEVKDNYKQDIATYNRHIERVAGDLKSEFPEANVWVFDTNSLFDEALDDPGKFEQTKDIKNTDSFCPEYAYGTPTMDYRDPMCDFPVNEYFWLNGLHPTYMIHDVLAEKVMGMLEQGPNVC